MTAEDLKPIYLEHVRRIRELERFLRDEQQDWLDHLHSVYPPGGTVVACDVPEYVGATVYWYGDEMTLRRDGQTVSGFCLCFEDDFYRRMVVTPPKEATDD
jgi:hypothetical protein